MSLYSGKNNTREEHSVKNQGFSHGKFVLVPKFAVCGRMEHSMREVIRGVFYGNTIMEGDSGAVYLGC